MNHLNLPFEVKSLNDAGRFEGYASVFGNVDLGGDIVERGAFKEFVQNEAGQVVVLWQHHSNEPIGVASVAQDKTGLRFSGDLVLDDPIAHKAYSHMKAGSVRGMSIGFDILPGGAEILNSGLRKLKSLKLWEISVVTFGMNPLAQVSGVKSLPETIREFEDFLRDVGGYSASQAKAIASGGFKALRDERDVPTREQLIQSLTATVKSSLKL
jgi:HK97 family phage prohead protease